MARFARVLTPIALVALTMCREAPPSAPRSASSIGLGRDAAPAAQLFRVNFDELNNSGVKGTATLQVIGGSLTVTLNANGRLPEHIHPQHIHGFATTAAACPTAANDTDGDGIISFAEGLPAFGPVQVDLQPYPTPTNSAGATQYRLAFTANQVPFASSDLTKKVMVLHGDFVAGAYVAGLPVACGVVEAVN